ncbi:MAG: ABC transporter ATP-binding protein [Patescibacteria group bacterium]
MTKNDLYALRLTIRYINRYPSYWFWFFIQTILVGIGIATPIIFGAIIDALATGDFSSRELYTLLVIYVVFLFISPAISIITVSKCLNIAAKVGRDFRNDAIRLFENAPIDFFKLKNRGVFLKIIDSAYDSIYRLTDDILHRYLSSVGSVIGILMSTAFIKPLILVIFLITSGLSIVNVIVFGRREEKARIEWSKKEEALTGGIVEFLNNFKTVFYLNLFAKQQADIAEKIEESYKKRTEVIRRSLRKWYNNGQLEQVTMILVFIFCVTNVMNGNFTIGTMTVVLAFVGKLSGQIGTLVGYLESFSERATALQRFNEEIAIPLEGQSLVKTGLLKDRFKKLALSNVGVSRDERENLTNASFTIKEKEKIAIVGHTGGGKSTLLDVILKAITDYQGSVTINNIEYRKLNGKDIVDVFSIVPQEVQLFRGTIRENISSSSESPSDGELSELLRICCLGEFINQLPRGVDEQLFEGSLNISGGERQRIGIARALFQNHPVLILDEATASLDPKTEREVVGNIMKAYPDLTLLYVTHKYSMLDSFDTIIVLSDGCIIENGPFEKLKRNGGLFRELYEASKVRIT